MSIFEEKETVVDPSLYTLTIDSEELILVLKDVEDVLKNSTLGNAVRFIIKDNILSIVCYNKIYYMATLNTNLFVDSEKSVVVVYKPISKLIPHKSSVVLRIGSQGVEIKTNISEFSLPYNIAEVNLIPLGGLAFVKSDLDQTKLGLKALTSTTAIINTIGKGINLNITKQYINAKYPTVYLEMPNHTNINNVVTKDIARIITHFLERGQSETFVAETASIQVYKRGTRYMSIPRVKSLENSIVDLFNLDDKLTNLSVTGMYEAVKTVVQSYGNGICSINYYKSGITINRNDAQINLLLKFGDIDESEFLFSVDVNIEHFRDVLSIIGESFSLYKVGKKSGLITPSGRRAII